MREAIDRPDEPCELILRCDEHCYTCSAGRNYYEQVITKEGASR